MNKMVLVKIKNCQQCEYFDWMGDIFPYCKLMDRKIEGEGIGREYYNKKIAKIPIFCPLMDYDEDLNNKYFNKQNTKKSVFYGIDI